MKSEPLHRSLLPTPPPSAFRRKRRVSTPPRDVSVEPGAACGAEAAVIRSATKNGEFE